MKKAIAALMMFVLITHALAAPANQASANRNAVVPQYKPPPLAEQKAEQQALPTNYAFVTETWTGNNQPYHVLRVQVDRELAAGQAPDELLPAAKAAAQAKSDDPKAQFLWAYIAYQARIMDYDHALFIKDRAKQGDATLAAIRTLEGVREALARIPFTHAYDYSRIHFLVASYTGQSDQEIRPLGLRLLHHDPTDYAVESTVITLLQPGVIPGDMALGLSLIKDSIRRYPALTLPREQLSGLYDAYWSDSGFHRAAADKAIAENLAFQRTLPANSPFRQIAVDEIEQIRSLQAFADKQRREGKPILGVSSK